ncbi:MAG: hypothetical protein U0798_20980 [Gemmataceae bacterium]
MPLPPRAEIIAAARDLLAPACIATLATSLVIGVLVRLVAGKFQCDWRRAMPAVFVLALSSSIVAVNYFRNLPLPWLPDGKWWHWAGPVIVACLLAEFINSCHSSAKYAFVLRGLVAGLAGHYLVPASWLEESPQWVPLVALWLAVSWTLGAEIARRQPGGSLCLAGSLFAGGAGIVLIHALSPGLFDLSLSMAVSLFLIAILAWLTKTDGSQALVTALTPILILIWMNRPMADSEVPVSCHRILATVPLAQNILFLPGLNRLLGTRFGGILLVILTLIPVVLAVLIAGFNAPLNFENDA